ncbi:HET-domain-containing protein [Coniochaeta sp. PMI_546]|nr:HET-domain-containing protein [Coniochaeta sp. PMI_546]
MRLIDVDSWSLEPPTVRPRRYAILSHTWGDDEISLQQLSSGIRAGKGWAKIDQACDQATKQGCDYLWVDTCCIDKTNSTELSEAINSMFRWYAEAEVCFAHLSDVPSDDDVKHRHSQFRKSRWFKRGWTLQELLAPKEVHFFSQDWTYLGSKAELKHLVEEITKIPSEVLVNGECRPPSRSIGEIFSWASGRMTTLEEDMAYSLLGLLNINIPLIYGEGTAAFTRVQEELLRRYDDESIFAWEAPPNEAITRPLCGLLSPTVAYFQASHRFVKPRIWTRLDSGPIMITNKGIALDLPLIPDEKVRGQHLALLNCRIVGLNEAVVQPAIRVQHLGGKQYARIDVRHIHDILISVSQTELCISRPMVFPQEPQVPLPVTAFLFDSSRGLCDGRRTVKVVQTSPEWGWGKAWSHALTLDCTPRPAPLSRRRSRSGLGEKFNGPNQSMSVSLTGGLKTNFYSGPDLFGSAYILCGLERTEHELGALPERVLPWCSILPASESVGSFDDLFLQGLPKGHRSEWPTELELSLDSVPSVRRFGTHVLVVVDIEETQGPGRVMYNISLSKSRNLYKSRT